MNDPLGRRFWQLHLSTLLLLVLIIGGMLGLNLKKQHEFLRAMPANPDIELVHVGWPLPVLEWDVTYAGEHEQGYISASAVNAVCNSLLCIGMAGCVAFLSEFLIRRREAQKP